MTESTRPSLCILIPVFNEAEALPMLVPRVLAALADVPAELRLLLVDDGSSDGSGEQLARLAAQDDRIGYLRLARNFGKEIAMSAGLDVADADAVVLLDADLQDPPEVVREFWKYFEQGYDNVYGVRSSRAGETALKKVTAAGFYRVIDRMSRTPIPRDTGDFRLLSRRAVMALRQLRERNRFMKGLFGWVGFRSIGVPYERAPRVAGTSKFNYWKLWNFALEGITSFSTAPLRLATYIGAGTAGIAFLFGAWIVFKTLAYGESVRGYPSLMVVMLFLGGVQLIALGLIGEYLGRLFEESKMRPLYLVDEVRLPRAGQSD
ncbi:MAG: glycosyltransferase family 2 protein [Ahniella sp.]|nr:glycosyltransferase family 2 protein [Ahniella sp.]